MNSADWSRILALVKKTGNVDAVNVPGTRTPLIFAVVVTGSHVGIPALIQPVIASRGGVVLGRLPVM